MFIRCVYLYRSSRWWWWWLIGEWATKKNENTLWSCLRWCSHCDEDAARWWFIPLWPMNAAHVLLNLTLSNSQFGILFEASNQQRQLLKVAIRITSKQCLCLLACRSPRLDFSYEMSLDSSLQLPTACGEYLNRIWARLLKSPPSSQMNAQNSLSFYLNSNPSCRSNCLLLLLAKLRLAGYALLASRAKSLTLCRPALDSHIVVVWTISFLGQYSNAALAKLPTDRWRYWRTIDQSVRTCK